MVAPAEKNPLIVIKLPFDLQERILTFPFLHKLKEHYGAPEIHFITPAHHIEVLNLLPFKAYYHEIDEEEMTSIFDVHRYAMTCKIFTCDIFISLTNSFVDACLGVALKAKIRLGFADGWKTLVLNQKTTRPLNHHLSEDFLALLKVHLGGELDTRIKVMSRELPPVIEEWESSPYVALNLSPLRAGAIREEWITLLSRFEGQRFVLFASEEQDKVEALLDPFLQRLPKENTYLPFIGKDWIEIGKMLSFARGVITISGPAAAISAYTGSKTLILFEREDPQRSGPFYFLGDVMIQLPGDTSDIGLIADRVFEFFKL